MSNQFDKPRAEGLSNDTAITLSYIGVIHEEVPAILHLDAVARELCDGAMLDVNTTCLFDIYRGGAVPVAVKGDPSQHYSIIHSGVNSAQIGRECAVHRSVIAARIYCHALRYCKLRAVPAGGLRHDLAAWINHHQGLVNGAARLCVEARV